MTKNSKAEADNDQRPQQDPEEGENIDLTPEDEAALDAAWENLGGDDEDEELLALMDAAQSGEEEELESYRKKFAGKKLTDDELDALAMGEEEK